MRKCSISGCERPVKTRGWCALHYQRWYHHGDPLPDKEPPGKRERFLDALLQTPETHECILWPFGLTPNGYAAFDVDGVGVNAHRYVCSAVHGKPAMDKLHAAHKCGNKKCVNPSHLRWATPSENHSDKIGHNRHIRGARNHMSKLRDEDVLDIKARLSRKETQVSIAKVYGITQAAISLIKKGRNWGYLT